MKCRMALLVIFLIICLSCIAGVSASDMNDTVMAGDIDLIENDTDISSESVVSEGNPNGTFSDLADEIDNAKGELNLTRNYICNGTYTDGVPVSKSIVINGNGFTIDGKSIARIFTVNHSDVVFHDIVFVNGKSTDGGAIYGSSTVINCTFVNNSANYDGGAIYGGSAVNCTFTGNSARESGGAMYGKGSSAVNCTFVNNSAIGYHYYDDEGDIWCFIGGYGGAMSGGSAVNCTFVNNSAIGYQYEDEDEEMWFIQGFGGAIGGGSAVNCTFTGNSACFGGAVYEGSCVNCSFMSNSANNESGAVYNGSAVNCTFVNNFASQSGGAMSGGFALNCNFTGNSAKGYHYYDEVEEMWFIEGYGGAMHGGFALNCTFAGNSASESGGAIDGGDALNCTFIDNSAGYCGGAMHNGSAVNCTFVNNSAYYDGGAMCGGSAVNCTFAGNSARESGGAIDGGDALNCTFVNNSAIGYHYYDDEGDIWRSIGGYGGAMHGGFAVNCTFVSNSAENGGAMSRGRATKCIFSYNNATAYGGAAFDSSVSFSSQFSNNYAPNGNDTYNVTWFDENIKSFTDLNDLIKNSNESSIYLNYNYTFDLNTDADFANGVYVNRILTIYGNGFTIDGKNIARIFGVSNKFVEFHDIVFVNGNTAGDGGAIFGSTIYEEEDIYYDGGGSDDFYCVNCTFIGNHADGNGGAVYGYCLVVNCSFINNSARNGGAVFDTWSTYIENCLFENNTATRYGGAIYKGYASDCIFNGNAAGKAGNNTYYTVMPNAVLHVTNFTSNYNSGDKLYVNLTYSNGVPINNANITIRVYKNNAFVGTYSCLSGDGWIVDLDAGDYVAVLSVEHNSYTVKPVNATLTIIKFDAVIVSDDIILTYNDGTRLVATLRDTNGNAIEGAKIKIVVSNKITRYITTDSNGQVSLAIYNLDLGTYNASVSFVGNDLYYKASTTSKITVTTKQDTALTADDAVLLYGVGGNLVATLVDGQGNAIGGAKLKIAIPNKLTKYVTTDSNGRVSLKISTLAIGNYTAAVTFIGTNLYNKSTTSAKVSVVDKMDTSLTVPDVSVIYGVGGNLVATLKDANGDTLSGAKLKLVIPGKVTKYVTTDANGQVSLKIPNLDIGTYAAAITFLATDLYNKAVATSKVFVVEKMDTTLIAEDVIATYPDSARLVATLKDANGNAISGAKLKIVIPGKVTKYVTTDSNGQVSLNVADLDLGNYVATVTFVATDLYNKASTTVKISVNKMNTALTVPDISVIYDVGGNLVATLKDANGNAVGGVKLKIVLNKVSKYITTDSNGQVSLKISNLDIGNYTATVTCLATDLYNKSTATANVFVVEKIDTVLTALDIIAVHNDGSKLFVTLKDANGDAISGAKVKIVIPNAVTKYITTDENGQISLKVSNYEIGNYTAAITFVATDLYNKSTATAKITVMEP